MMAESWRRLQEGKPEPHDITLKRRVHSMIKLAQSHFLCDAGFRS